MALLAWASVRLLIVLALAFIAKDWILNLLGDPHGLTLFVIGLASTPVSRVLVFFAFWAVLTAAIFAIMSSRPKDGYWIAAGAGALLTLALFYYFDTSFVRAVPVIALLSAALIPDSVLARYLPAGRPRETFMAIAVGLAEVFLLRHYLAWLAALWTGRESARAWPLWAAVLLAAFLAAGASAILLHPAKIAGFEQGLRMSPSVRILAENDVNWIELSDDGSQLFVTGHGVERVLRYDTDDFSRKPRTVAADTGNAQAFALDRQARELHVYNERLREMLSFDTESLSLRRRFPVKGLASGDPWLVADHRSGNIVINSEADENDGISFLTIDRITGAERDRRELDAGNLLLDGEKSRLYMSFFRRRSQLIRYDLTTLTIDKSVAAPPRADRMAYRINTNEILLTEPIASRVLRYDADTLEYKGDFAAIFGVRALAIDDMRNLLLCGSLATGEVAVIDLATYKIRSRHYLGPWLRSIVVNPKNGLAYVSSNGFLYELKYDERL